MPVSPVIFQKAESFEDQYNKQFGGDDRSFREISQDVLSLVKENSRKIAIVYGVIVIIVGIVLYKFQPSIILKSNFNKMGQLEQVIDYQSLLFYTLLFSFIFCIIITFFIERNERVKGLLNMES